jgi:hydrogenase-4 membrane subunit HyfE
MVSPPRGTIISISCVVVALDAFLVYHRHQSLDYGHTMAAMKMALAFLTLLLLLVEKGDTISESVPNEERECELSGGVL